MREEFALGLWNASNSDTRRHWKEIGRIELQWVLSGIWNFFPARFIYLYKDACYDILKIHTGISQVSGWRLWSDSIIKRYWLSKEIVNFKTFLKSTNLSASLYSFFPAVVIDAMCLLSKGKSCLMRSGAKLILPS